MLLLQAKQNKTLSKQTFLFDIQLQIYTVFLKRKKILVIECCLSPTRW